MNLLNNITTFKGERSRAASSGKSDGRKGKSMHGRQCTRTAEKGKKEVSVFQWEKRRSLQI